MINLSDDIILDDFYDIWFVNCDARYRALKGGRETGKTFNFIGFEPIFKILSDERRNILMIRANDKDNRKSTFPMLVSTLRRLKIMHLFKIKYSDLTIIRKETGQEIRFAGMNDVENITGTSFESGYWTDIYFEEASQLESYDDFRVVDGSLRIPSYESDLKAQITFLFNAWDVGHWLYDVFFKTRLEDNPETLEYQHYQYFYDPEFSLGAAGKGLALHISSVWCNPYINEEKKESVLKLRELAYDIYLVEVLGCWGNTADRTYEHYSDGLIRTESVINKLRFDSIVIGIDTGLSNGEGKIKYTKDNAKRLGSAMTMQMIGVSNDWDKLVCVDEYFDSNLGRSTTEKKKELDYVHELCKKLTEWNDLYNLWEDNIIVYVDAADVGFRDNMDDVAHSSEYNLYNLTFMSSIKRPILERVRFTNLLMAHGDLLISERCKNLIREIKNARKAEDGRVREDFDDHAINAWEYAWAPVRVRLNLWKDFKPSI